MIKPKLVATITQSLSRIGVNSSHEIILRYTTMFKNMSRGFFMFAYETQKIWLVSSQNNSSSVIRTRCIAAVPHTYYINGNSEQEKNITASIELSFVKNTSHNVSTVHCDDVCGKKYVETPLHNLTKCQIGVTAGSIDFCTQKHSIMLYFLRARVPSGGPIWSYSV